MILLGNTVPSCCPPQGHVQIILRYPIDPTFPSGLDHCFGEWKCGDDSRDENLHEQNSKEGARLGPSLAFKSNIARSYQNIYIYGGFIGLSILVLKPMVLGYPHIWKPAYFWPIQSTSDDSRGMSPWTWTSAIRLRQPATCLCGDLRSGT